MQFIVIGSEGDNRINLFQNALAQRNLPPAKLVTYLDLLTGVIHLSEVVCNGAIVRIESPGRDFEVEKAFLRVGADAADAEARICFSPSEVTKLVFDKGRIWSPRQWYLGFCDALKEIESQLVECNPHYRLNTADEIAVMFDKTACHSLLAEHGVAVPRGIQTANGYDNLVSAMERGHCSRVFIKLAHGSSAAGTIAYQRAGEYQRAITTIEMVERDGEVVLYNSRQIRTVSNPREIRRLIDALSRHRVHVEEWIPKAAYEDRVFDLRVVMIGGEVRHTVVRLSHSPMTNLHLLNERAGVEVLCGKLPDKAWKDAQVTCQQAAEQFPNSLCCGIDLLFEPRFKRHYILEVNAFGDLLPNVLDRGQTTYDAQIDAVLRRGIID